MTILNYSDHSVTVGVAAVAERRLHEGPYYYFRNLRCQFEGGVLTLRGRVPFRQLKQLAESIVGRVEGVREIENRIEVCDPMLVNAPAVRNAG